MAGIAGRLAPLRTFEPTNVSTPAKPSNLSVLRYGDVSGREGDCLTQDLIVEDFVPPPKMEMLRMDS